MFSGGITRLIEKQLCDYFYLGENLFWISYLLFTFKRLELQNKILTAVFKPVY